MDSNLAIKAERLSKRYQLGSMRQAYSLLSENIGDFVRSRILGRTVERPAASREDLWALKDVSFEVPRGEVLGVIGRNGAGKSTLLKVLSRITTPTAGRIEINGRVGSLLEVGTGFHPELTGRENIYLNGSILGMTKAEINAKFDEIVDFSEIERFIDTPVKRYSSGMHVRLGFAVAAHLQPEILLVDEVLAVGDVEFQRKCLNRIDNVTNQGNTVLMVTHNMHAILYHCTRAMLLDRGEVAAIGEVQQMVQQYLAVQGRQPSLKLIDEADHVTGITKLQIMAMELLEPVNGAFAVYWNQPIRVRVVFKVLEKIEEASFGAGIRSMHGVPILSVHHDDAGDRRWTIEPGRYQLEFELQNSLRPGRYRIGVGVHEKYVAKNVCYLPEAADIEVLDYCASGEMPQPYNAGLVNGVSSWTAPHPCDDHDK